MNWKVGLVGLMAVGMVIMGGRWLMGREARVEKAEEKVEEDAELMIRASIPYWDQKEALASLWRHEGVFDEVALFWYYLGEDGEVRTYEYADEDTELVVKLKEAGMRVGAVISNLPEGEGAEWDSGRIERMLENDKSRKKHIDAVKEKLVEVGFDGVSIDYEAVKLDAKEGYGQFIEELTLELGSAGLFVGVAMHPATADDPGQGEFQDWRRIGEAADYLYVMGYGEHWDSSGPGPVASVEWVEEVVEYGINQGVDRRKIILGIPLYGYDWKLESDGPAEGLTYNEVEELRQRTGEQVRWDGLTQTPWFEHEEDGAEHQVWFEDGDSVMAKVKVAEKYGLGGVSFWRLGGEDEKVWRAMTKE